MIRLKIINCGGGTIGRDRKGAVRGRRVRCVGWGMGWVGGLGFRLELASPARNESRVRDSDAQRVATTLPQLSRRLSLPVKSRVLQCCDFAYHAR
jgi:hypothetical protein